MKMMPNGTPSGKPKILVTVEPYVEMVHQIAGDKVEILSVIPAGVDPHNWEPTIKDMSKLGNARIWFTIGETFEGTLFKKLHEVTPSLSEVSLASVVDLISPEAHAHPGCNACYDTHLWLSPKEDIKQSKLILETLIHLMPDESQYFAKNQASLEAKLVKMDQRLTKSLAPYKGKVLVTTHGAYTYFCRDYGIKQLVIEPSSGKEPRSQDITKVVNQIRTEKANIIGIFIQPQHANKAAKKIAALMKFPIYMVDPYEREYLKTMITLQSDISGP